MFRRKFNKIADLFRLVGSESIKYRSDTPTPVWSVFVFVPYIYSTSVKISKILSSVQATEEVRCLEAFYKMLKNEPARAFYGAKHVMAACEAEAIETLLISDKLFRANNVAERKKGGLFSFHQ